MISVTCGKLPRPCRGDWGVMELKSDLGRRYALPQATPHRPLRGHNADRTQLNCGALREGGFPEGE